MQELIKENFDAAIKKCQEIDKYKVLIVTEYLKSQDWIKDNWLLDQGIVTNKFPTSIQVKFPNGSRIDGVSLSYNVHGLKCNLCLCEPWMFRDDDLRCILQAMEINNIDFKFKYEEV